MNELPETVASGETGVGSSDLVRRRDLGLVCRLVKVTDHEATGRLMRMARLKRGFSLRELARRLKLSPAYVSDLELGRRGWTVEKIDRWADILCAPNAGGQRP